MTTLILMGVWCGSICEKLQPKINETVGANQQTRDTEKARITRTFLFFILFIFKNKKNKKYKRKIFSCH
jgi:hypothetical protein